MALNDISFTILKLVVAVASVLVTYYLVPALRKYAENKDNEQLVTMIELAVRAAEQTFTGGGQGKAKKEDVMKFVTEWLNERGIKISDEQLSQLIEAAVYSMKQAQEG